MPKPVDGKGGLRLRLKPHVWQSLLSIKPVDMSPASYAAALIEHVINQNLLLKENNNGTMEEVPKRLV